MLSKSRLSVRLAWRDITRNKGRSVLATVLLALPIAGVAVGATAYSSMDSTDSETARQYTGDADVYVNWTSDQPIDQHSYHGRSVHWERTSGSESPDPAEVDELDDIERDADELREALPAGSEISEYNAHMQYTAVGFFTEDGYHNSLAVPGDLSDPLVASIYDVKDGDVPDSGEIAINPALARQLDADVGDTVTADVDDVETEFTVSGIVEHPRDLHQDFFFSPDIDANESNTWLVSTPDTFTMEDADKLNELGITVYAASLADTPPLAGGSDMTQSAEEVSILALLVGIVIIQVVLLAGPAFAISAKRRRREFAILSSAGASPSHIRRIVLYGGVLLGVIAAVVGIGVGIGATYLALPVIENLLGRRSPSFGVWPEFQLVVAGFAVVTGLLASLAAAISASRVDVVTAMTGRRTQTRIRKRWPILGAVLVAGGATLVATGAIMQGPAVLLATIAMFQLGLALCAPMMVTSISRLGGILPLAPRIALRDAGRNRSATAPAIAAVMAVVAAGLAFSMYAISFEQRTTSWVDMNDPAGFEAAMSYSVSVPPDDEKTEIEQLGELQDEFLPLLETHLDNPDVLANPMAQCQIGEDPEYCSYDLQRPPHQECPYDENATNLSNAQQAAAVADPHCVAEFGTSYDWNDLYIVTSPELLSMYTDLRGAELDQAWSELEAGAIGIGDDVWIDDLGNVSILLNSYEHETEEMVHLDGEEYVFPALELDYSMLGNDVMLASAETAEQLHSQPYAQDSSTSYVVRTDSDPHPDAIQALNSFAHQVSHEDEAMWFDITVRDDGVSSDLALVWTIAGISLVIALGSTLVATGLVAAESRRDLRTLGAIGASPGLRRKLSLWQAGVISLLGSGMGVAAGVTIFVVIVGSFNSRITSAYPIEHPYPIDIPLLNLGTALVLLPLVAMAITGMATRSRLPSENRRAD